jgi:hypothetical protein
VRFKESVEADAPSRVAAPKMASGNRMRVRLCYFHAFIRSSSKFLGQLCPSKMCVHLDVESRVALTYPAASSEILSETPHFHTNSNFISYLRRWDCFCGLAPARDSNAPRGGTGKATGFEKSRHASRHDPYRWSECI